MENLVIGKLVIVSSERVYGFGKCISKNEDGSYTVLMKRGYNIDNGQMKNINDVFDSNLKIQDHKYAVINDLMYEKGLHYCDIEGPEIDDYYNNFMSLESSTVEKGVEKNFRFSREQIIVLDDDCDDPRLIWNQKLNWKERLGIVGKLLLDPAEYDNCIVGYDDDCVYYELEEIIHTCHYLMPNCDPADNVYNNMIRACQYISSAPYIRFVEDYDTWTEHQMELDPEEEDSLQQVSFNDQSWAVVD